jgi:hypothetical protein
MAAGSRGGVICFIFAFQRCANNAQPHPPAQALRSRIFQFISKHTFSKLAHSLRCRLEPGDRVFVCRRLINNN